MATIDERLDRLTQRHEALAESLELLTRDVREMVARMDQQSERMDMIARLVVIHERRLNEIQGTT